MNNMMPGSWTNWSFDLNGGAQKLFNRALADHIGVDYQPIAYATRATPEENYVFLCVANKITNPPTSDLALVFITSAGKVRAKLETVKDLGLNANGLPGGYSLIETPPSAEKVKLFEEAMEQIIGVDYTPFAVTSQVVSQAVNYIYLAEGVIVTPEQPTFAGLVYITQQGSDLTVKDIKRILPTGIEEPVSA